MSLLIFERDGVHCIILSHFDQHLNRHVKLHLKIKRLACSERVFCAMSCLYRPFFEDERENAILMRIKLEIKDHPAKYTKAIGGENRFQRSPVKALATIFPKLCTVARSPKADPRISVGARVATATCSLVSMQPIANPATMKLAARTIILGTLTAKPR